METNLAIEKVDVAAELIEGIKDENGEGWIVVRRMCEVLGIDAASQWRRLQNLSWATVVTMTTVAADGKNRDLFCLHVDSVPMWLATIDENRVNEAARPKLQRFQKEASKALAAWMNGESLPPAPVSKAMSVYDMMRQQTHLLEQMINDQERVEKLALEAATKAEETAKLTGALQAEVAQIKEADAKRADELQEFYDVLDSFPEPGEVPEKTTRMIVNAYVRAVVEKRHADHGKVWTKIYKEFRDRYHWDPQARARNARKSRNKSSIRPIDVIEEANMMQELYDLVRHLFPMDS